MIQPSVLDAIAADQARLRAEVRLLLKCGFALEELVICTQPSPYRAWIAVKEKEPVNA